MRNTTENIKNTTTLFRDIISIDKITERSCYSTEVEVYYEVSSRHDDTLHLETITCRSIEDANICYEELLEKYSFKEKEDDCEIDELKEENERLKLANEILRNQKDSYERISAAKDVDKIEEKNAIINHNNNTVEKLKNMTERFIDAIHEIERLKKELLNEHLKMKDLEK